MTSAKKQLGDWGEQLVAKTCPCPRCKNSKTFKLLPPNFKCADLICDFCGFLAQVKTTSVPDSQQLPSTILGAAWKPQKERMDAAIYLPLYVVLKGEGARDRSIYYLSADLQLPDMFKPRKPLSQSAKRAGWQGFVYDLTAAEGRIVKVF